MFMRTISLAAFLATAMLGSAYAGSSPPKPQCDQGYEAVKETENPHAWVSWLFGTGFKTTKTYYVCYEKKKDGSINKNSFYTP